MFYKRLPISFLLICFTVIYSFAAERAIYQLMGENHPESNLPLAKLSINQKTIIVELAQTDTEKQYGLMNRYMLPQNRGMLFIFAEEAPRSFWMKNTKIALDILYFNGEGILVGAVEAVPCVTVQCPSYPSNKPAKYVLELGKGEQERLGIKLGDQLNIVVNRHEITKD